MMLQQRTIYVHAFWNGTSQNRSSIWNAVQATRTDCCLLKDGTLVSDDTSTTWPFAQE